MNLEVLPVKIIESVVYAMMPVIPYVNFEPGNSLQIIQQLQSLDDAPSLKGKKYPLIAMMLPAPISRGSVEHYGVVRIPKIVIATFSNDTDPVLNRYNIGGTFKSILYPCYYEFLKQLAYSPYIIGTDEEAFVHTLEENPGSQREKNSSDYVDTLTLLNLELTLNQIKTC